LNACPLREALSPESAAVAAAAVADGVVPFLTFPPSFAARFFLPDTTLPFFFRLRDFDDEALLFECMGDAASLREGRCVLARPEA
jgi:hypothetical protein